MSDPFALTTAEVKTQYDDSYAVGTAFAVLQDTIRIFNEEKTEAFKKVTAAIEAYNEARATASGHFEDIHRRVDEVSQARSERWAESERGEAVAAWILEIESLAEKLSATFDDVTEPEDIDADALDGEGDSIELLDETPNYIFGME